jgi:membrane protein required for colicin V production
MNGADFLMIGVLLFSVLLGTFRGFMAEAIAVLAWLGGVWLAWRYAPLVEPFMGGMLSEPPVRTWAARVIIVMAVVILGWIASGLLVYMVRYSGLSISVDRLLGALFGVVRAIVVISAFVLLGQFARLDQAKWWHKSRLLPYAMESAAWIETFAETGMKMLEDQKRSSRYSPSHYRIAAAPGV